MEGIFKIKTVFWVLLITKTLINSGDLNAQTWQWQHGGALKDVHFVNKMQGWAVGLGGAIIHTTNGGQNWEIQYSGTTFELKSVHFLDAQKGWIVGLGGTLLYSADGGQTWEPQFPPVLDDFSDIFFVNAQTGWILGNSILLYTSDGGQSWIDKTNGIPAGFAASMEKIFFSDAQNGWITKNGSYLTTTNEGQSWSIHVNSPCNNSLNENSGLFFINSQVGWIGNNLYIARTSNGGQSWTCANQGNAFESIYFTNIQNGYAVNSTGALMRTTNSGSTWSITTGYPALYSIYFFDAQNGWAVGKTILRTTNGGQSWEDLGFMNSIAPVSYSGLDDVFFTDSQNGWAAGGRLFHTSNGGKDWILQPSPGASSFFNDIYFLNQQLGWIVGASGIIYKTTNGGQTWATLNTGSNCISNVFFINAQIGWAVGSNKTIIKTTNGGQSWAIQLVGSASSCFNSVEYDLKDVYFTDTNNGWAVGEFPYNISTGIILHTSDGGQNWVKQGVDYYGINSIAHVGGSKAWALGRNTLWSTTNGGQNWNPQPIGLGIECFNYSVDFSNPQSGWFISGLYQTNTAPGKVAIFHTNNAGQYWNSEEINVKSYYPPLKKLFFKDESNGWVVGENELIFKYGPPPSVSTSSPNDSPASIVFGKIYPQPGVREFNLDVFSKSSGEQLLLKLFNSSGQFISELQEVLNQGNNVLTVPSELLPTGVYYLTVQTRSLVKTFPLIKL